MTPSRSRNAAGITPRLFGVTGGLSRGCAAISSLELSDICKPPPLGKHVSRDLDHILHRDVPHAAVVVHLADRALAGLAGEHALVLDHGRGEAVEGGPEIGAGWAENAHGGCAE